MLNLAGIDLIVDSPQGDAINFINKYIELSSYRPWTRPAWPGAQVSALTFGWPRREPTMHLNRFVWPQGASRWAYGHFLASSDQVNEIMGNAYSNNGKYNAVTFKIGTPDVEPVTDNTDPSTYGQDNIITATKMYVLPPMPLSGIRGLKGDTQSLYLISIVDQRFFWYENSTGAAVVSISWGALYDIMAQSLGITIKRDDISTKYLNPSPSMFGSLQYQPVPYVLDAIAFNVGQRIVVGYDGSVAARNATVESNALLNDFATHPKTRFVMAGGSAFSNPL